MFTTRRQFLAAAGSFALTAVGKVLDLPETAAQLPGLHLRLAIQ
jgi:hypothetical protein